ncbi:hypothetical protein OSB04_030953 [Centaurea solstitialis]|uniref:Serine carboxypeptidase n=1 Tax=Centaurea solstitialis TaxID=347529 RepID=A0AA38W4A5_9ASTR|nr:hypothetical protein OSB04_030953 [Centaurea solstitialis]
MRKTDAENGCGKRMWKNGCGKRVRKTDFPTRKTGAENGRGKRVRKRARKTGFPIRKTDFPTRKIRKSDSDLKNPNSGLMKDGTYIYSSTWANSRDVREALHVRKELNNIEWVRCNETLHFRFGVEPIAYIHNVWNVVGYHQRLADKNCRALVYSGDHDMVVPYISTLNWIESLNLSVKKDWKPWFVNEQVAGYTMEFLKNEYNLTYATVKARDLSLKLLLI